ncbi:MAG: selenium cofactor biosynthesis protein YqeC [Gammaproteobacteria bacterium]
MNLLEALGRDSGVICLVGAGGKKTCMYHLASTHPGRVLLTSTAHMYPYDAGKIDRLIEWEEAGSGFVLNDNERVIALASRTDTPKRIGGISGESLEETLRQHSFDLCVVKGDGARARWIKAPADYEPIIPAATDVVVPIIAIKAIGRPLDKRTAHRPEKIAELVGNAPGDLITGRAVAKLLSHELGSLKGTEQCEVVPLLNMVDNKRSLNLARKVARNALEQTDRFDRILLASMKQGEIKEIVSR